MGSAEGEAGVGGSGGFKGTLVGLAGLSQSPTVSIREVARAESYLGGTQPAIINA